jgi:hypothetical protein
MGCIYVKFSNILSNFRTVAMFVIDLQRFTHNLKVHLCVRIYLRCLWNKALQKTIPQPPSCTKQNMITVAYYQKVYYSVSFQMENFAYPPCCYYWLQEVGAVSCGPPVTSKHTVSSWAADMKLRSETAESRPMWRRNPASDGKWTDKQANWKEKWNWRSSLTNPLKYNGNYRYHLL